MEDLFNSRYFSLENFPGEKWVDVDEEYNFSMKQNYQISTKGRIKSISIVTGKEKIRKPCIGDNGRLFIRFGNYKGKPRRGAISILVAKGFIPNPENKSEVHHIDKNPLNNNIENLMWVTHDEHTLIHGKSRHVFVSYNREGNLVKVYDYIYDVEKDGFRHNLVTRCCRGLIKNTGGLIWRCYKSREDVLDKITDFVYSNKVKCIARFTLRGDLVKVYGLIKDVEKDGFNPGAVSSCLKGRTQTSGGQRWEYISEEEYNKYLKQLNISND